MMFWGITFICEEYGVPSLRRFCDRHKFSDAVTGSLFIGTGLSIPVFFIAIVGLFVSNSAIGVGTVVGGNAFNQLITIPSSIYVSPLYTMKVDPIIFTREMFCYFLTCLLLIWATQKESLRHGFVNVYSEDQWLSCLSISWFSSLILICAYVLYCFISIYVDPISSRCYQFFLSSFGYAQSEISEPVAEQELSNKTNPIDTEYGLVPNENRNEERVQGINPNRTERVNLDDQNDIEISLSHHISETEQSNSQR